MSLNKEKLIEITKKFGTPVYIFDTDLLNSRMRMIKNTLGEDITLCYAMKANPLLVDAMKENVEKYEVCSPGEFSICERENIAMERIVLSGVNKERCDIEHVMEIFKGAGIYTVESGNQLNLLSDCAKERGLTIDVLLRVTSGNQFGLDEGDIEDIIKNRDCYESINFKGIQYYSGTQKKKIESITKELEWLDGICENLDRQYGFKADELEYGPGLPFEYFEPDADKNNYDMLREFSAILDTVRGKYHITLEMGRYLVAECGLFLTRIADIKTNKGQGYCIIDGGINHINYYGQTMAMKLPKTEFIQMDDSVSSFGSISATKWNICGSLCTVGDVIVKNLPLENPQIGDLLVFHNIGAYSVTEGIYLFLSRRMPKILAYSETEGAVVIRDALNSDLINSRKICLD